MSASIANWRSLWAILVEPPTSNEEVERQVEAGELPTLSFLSMLICSTAIATLGLLGNSAAVIIGAMIIAPIMPPILSFSFGIVEAYGKLAVQSFQTILVGTFLTLGLSIAIAEVIGWSIAGSEIAARTQPATGPASGRRFGVAVRATSQAVGFSTGCQRGCNHLALGRTLLAQVDDPTGNL